MTGICRRIWGTKPALNLIGMTVGYDKISYSFRCNYRLLYAIDPLLNYSRSGCILNVILSRVFASLALVNEIRTNPTEALLVPF